MSHLFLQDQLAKFEEELTKHSVSYDYDTKEFPIEVIVHKFDPILPDSQPEMFIPDYQREFVWDIKMQSEFIESLFLWMPIQAIFVSTNEEGLLEIIDGSQRIRTINAFVKNEFKIEGVTKLTQLNGLKFSDMPPARQRKFKLIPIRFHNISDKATLEIRKDIFRRINKHEQLTASEIRKGSYEGHFYSFIQECAKNPDFRELCPITKEVSDRGEYEELLLRFFAYTDIDEKWGINTKERGKPLLDKYLEDKNQNGFSEDEKWEIFNKMIVFVKQYFPLGFKKTANANATPRVRFEAIAVGVHYALKENPTIQPVSVDWLNSSKFKEVTTSDSSGNTGRLKQRVNFVKDCLLGNAPKHKLQYDNQ